MYTNQMRRRVFGALGQSAAERPAVVVIQRALRAIAAENDNADYFPGQADGRYGMNTHAAIIRVSRDFLEPAGSVSSTCRSTCNTLWTRARSACKACLSQMLSAMNQQFSIGLATSDIASIADAYGEWLDAYVARYGDGGQLDPAQIARRESVSLDEAERLAAERSGVPEGGDTVAIGPIEGEIEGPPATRRAGFPWLVAILSVVAIGGAGVAYWYFSRKPEGEEGLDFESEQDWLR